MASYAMNAGIVPRGVAQRKEANHQRNARRRMAKAKKLHAKFEKQREEEAKDVQVLVYEVNKMDLGAQPRMFSALEWGKPLDIGMQTRLNNFADRVEMEMGCRVHRVLVDKTNVREIALIMTEN